jgi:predicted ATPase
MHNLASQLTSFVGRLQEVDSVALLLANARLLTITGPGGVGKTRLAIEVARQAPADDVWFVELAPVVDSALIVPTMASALGVADVSNEPLLDTLVRFLQGRSSLLVLDNCEHMIAAVAAIAIRLLAACPTMTLLATSRESLNIAGEAVQRLAPLVASDGVALLLDRAAAAGCPISTEEQEQEAIADLCSQLDGLPLAIELATPYLRLLSVQELAARLIQHFELLESRERDALPRHQTLRALVDWSHELLTDDERCLYRRLSVFAGGCTFEAIDGVCADPLLPTSAVLPALRGLVEKSLVVAEQHDGETRYAMLETLRQHARERLVAADEEHSLRHLHLAWFRCMAERAEAAFQGDEPLRWAAARAS